MASYLCVRVNESSVKSYPAATATQAGKPYLRVGTESFPLTTETSAGMNVHVKMNGSSYVLAEKLKKTTTFETSSAVSSFISYRESAGVVSTSRDKYFVDNYFSDSISTSISTTATRTSVYYTITYPKLSHNSTAETFKRYTSNTDAFKISTDFFRKFTSGANTYYVYSDYGYNTKKTTGSTSSKTSTTYTTYFRHENAYEFLPSEGFVYYSMTILTGLSNLTGSYLLIPNIVVASTSLSNQAANFLNSMSYRYRTSNSKASSKYFSGAYASINSVAYFNIKNPADIIQFYFSYKNNASSLYVLKTILSEMD